MRTIVGVALILASALTVGVVNERLIRTGAIDRMDAALSTAAEGTTIDLAIAFDLDWDRAAVLGGYEPGFSANELLGFHAYGELDDLAIGDGVQWLVFARNGHVIADFLIADTPHLYYFAAMNVAMQPNEARFIVHRVDGFVELRPATVGTND